MADQFKNIDIGTVEIPEDIAQQYGHEAVQPENNNWVSSDQEPKLSLEEANKTIAGKLLKHDGPPEAGVQKDWIDPASLLVSALARAVNVGVGAAAAPAEQKVAEELGTVAKGSASASPIENLAGQAYQTTANRVLPAANPKSAAMGAIAKKLGKYAVDSGKEYVKYKIMKGIFK